MSILTFPTQQKLTLGLWYRAFCYLAGRYIGTYYVYVGLLTGTNSPLLLLLPFPLPEVNNDSKQAAARKKEGARKKYGSGKAMDAL
jgi:hypothetical protein